MKQTCLQQTPKARIIVHQTKRNAVKRYYAKNKNNNSPFTCHLSRVAEFVETKKLAIE